MNTERGPSEVRLSTGVTGLDEVLHGGFLPGRTYLVRGGPGTGKTMLGLHFLTAGAARGERTLFITVEEPTEQIRRDASALGFELSGIRFVDLTPGAELFMKAQSYDIFTPAEVEREPTTRMIVEEIESVRPDRVFLEAMTQFRYLSPDPFQYHKQVLSLLRFLEDRGATVLFTSEGSDITSDEHLQFLSDGVVHLEATPTSRSVSVIKFRGSDYESGRHSLQLTDRGMAVYPRLVPGRHGRQFIDEDVPSGIRGLDEQLHGGLERGTVTLITGPTGVGKTTLGMSFVKEAAARGERSCVYLIEEAVETMLRRSEALGIPARGMIDGGMLSAVHIEPLRYGPDEFAHLVRHEVETNHARIVMIDSVAGYRLWLHGDDLTRHLHALCAYLRNMGVTVLLLNETETITGDFAATELGISHVADNIVFLRYLELHGRLERAIGVLKKRVSSFETTLREFEISAKGVRVGRPLTELRGILSGYPELAKGGRSDSRAA
ncbi:MAG TPA: ATPase domain-containing protein [Labilithrix sp.]|nr:ATPase domain-containing protein [Labilithrix sp.]